VQNNRNSFPFYKQYQLNKALAHEAEVLKAKGPDYYKPLSIPIPTGQGNTLVARYTAGTRLFIDAPYYDQIGDKRFEGLFLVQIPRHHKEVIVVKAKKPLTVYRLLSVSNDNGVFMTYEETEINVKIVGEGSVNTKVVKKSFPEGTISLAPGGPLSAAPILISIAGQQ
jgi:hypothetical protein